METSTAGDQVLSSIDRLDVIISLFILVLITFSLFFIKKTWLKKMPNTDISWFENDPSLVTGKFWITPETPAIPMDSAGRGIQLFFQTTFGNEYFLTSVAGLDKIIPEIQESITKLQGKSTTGLVVRGINTGLQVSRGAMLPVGIVPVLDPDGVTRYGISCALCHSRIHPDTGYLMMGVPNVNLQMGKLLAMLPNSGAFYDVAGIDPNKFDSNNDAIVDDSKTTEFEKACDTNLEKWPPGSIDFWNPLILDPVSIPSCFVRGNAPFNWAGDAGMDVDDAMNGYCAIINSFFRYNSNIRYFRYLPDFEKLRETKPKNMENFFKENYLSKISRETFFENMIMGAPYPRQEIRDILIDNNLGLEKYIFPGAMQGYQLDRFLIDRKEDYRFFETDLDALAIFLSSLNPPTNIDQRNKEGLSKQESNDSAKNNDTKQVKPAERGSVQHGTEIFIIAGCEDCHPGPFYSCNRITPLLEIKSDPSVCLKYNAQLQNEKIYGLNYKSYGYKTMSLRGLYWTAPYLHNHSVAVGPNMELGIGQTIMQGVPPDPYESLRALLDRNLRNELIEQTLRDIKSAILPGYNNRDPRILPVGHEYWVDRDSGFTKTDQNDLIYFILSLDEKPHQYQSMRAEDLPFTYPQQDPDDSTEK